MNGGTLTDNKLNAECLAIKTLKPIVKGIFKNVIFLLCASNYDLWHNILHTNEGFSALVFCGTYYKMYIQVFYDYNTFISWQVLLVYAIGWYTLYRLTECIIN
jgi:hypothetical protein